MTTTALNVRELSVQLTDAPGVRQVVDRISFSINRGESLGLVGESGCGKSIAALAILGLIPALHANVSSAGIEVNGRDISSLGAAEKRQVLGRDIAMVFQQPATALDPVFTLGQQISAVFYRHGARNKSQARQAMFTALEDVGFNQPEEIASAYPHDLSGGMRQLAMIAMATVCKPAVLIADEPTTALDSSTRAIILQQFKRLQTDHKIAILLISHDLTVIRQVCDNVMVMYCGRLLEKARTDALFSHPLHPYSAGLLACIPRIVSTRPVAINAIPGQVPSITNLPQGCHYSPRCSFSEAQCQQAVPSTQSENGRSFACFRPLR